ncbi:DNA-binding protein [Paracoccus gahaiensis]|uniref:DNA-binding protein n=1 Tax=Paracoccus gahaiensis TaxID=1706839 RepID=A0A4U0RFM7_9RHOB|nr:DNA-binding protein [Paracoccus gahaiensis]
MTEEPLHDAPPIDRWRLDALLEAPVKGKLWGLPQIAAFLGVSVDTARRWARLPDVPIYRPPGTTSYCAFQSELRSWLRSKPTD